MAGWLRIELSVGYDWVNPKILTHVKSSQMWHKIIFSVLLPMINVNLWYSFRCIRFGLGFGSVQVFKSPLSLFQSFRACGLLTHTYSLAFLILTASENTKNHSVNPNVFVLIELRYKGGKFEWLKEIKNLQGSISSTFYAFIFPTKVLHAVFL